MNVYTFHRVPDQRQDIYKPSATKRTTHNMSFTPQLQRVACQKFESKESNPTIPWWFYICFVMLLTLAYR